MKRAIQTVLLSLTLSYAVGQVAPASPVALRQVRVVRQSTTEVQIEISLSGPVTPEILAAEHPKRLILVLPGTSTDSKQKRIVINANGIRAVRYALNQSSPPETHVVVDLESDRLYKLSTRDNKVFLTLQSDSPAEAKRRIGPVPAASAPITSVFRRQQSIPPSIASSSQNSAPIAPAPSQPPSNFPGDTSAASRGTTTSVVTTAPSARHPNVGSLVEGTVFPGMGTPGTGTVPKAVGSKSQPSGFDQKTAASAAQVQPTASPSVVGIPFPKETSQPSQAATDRKTESPVPTAALPTVVTQSTATESKPATAKPSSAEINSIEPPAAVTATNQAVIGAEKKPAALTASASEMLSAAPGVENQPSGATVSSDNPPLATVPVPEKLPALATRPELRKAFRVKYVAQDSAYLEGGRSGGLAEGMKLIVREDPASGETVVSAATEGVDENGIAELQVISVAETSAVTDIHAPKRPVKAGDLAYLSAGDQEALVERDALSATRKYPTVISFTEGDTLDDEAREEVPKPPLPSVNRARGRIGVDYMGMMSHDGTGFSNSNLGLVVRTDITRINGTYWNLSGYWRGRLNSRSSSSQPTLQDLLNRTYHLSMTYDNPNSAWVAGFGRLYLPWASSLDTIDGGYFGRHVSTGTTVGIFAGSTPDPTSWSYNPDGRIGGAFVNFAGGSYDGFHYTSTSGIGLSALKWTLQRPFVFFENGLSYKRFLSIYQSLQADSPRGNPDQPAPGPGIGRSFTTLRIQPHPRIEFNVNHTYFRDLPTFDPTLIGTGLLDKYLFQGFSAGTRIEVLKQIWLYTDLGRSSRTGDAKSSLNEMYGVTFGKLPWIGVRADARYSRFNSAFGSGSYRALSLSRNFGENFRLELLAGDQQYASSLTSSDRNRFINGSFETNLGTNYFLQGGVTINRGQIQKYDQWYLSFGYRFDSRQKKAH
jgi:hypothetical protein